MAEDHQLATPGAWYSEHSINGVNSGAGHHMDEVKGLSLS